MAGSMVEEALRGAAAEIRTTRGLRSRIFLAAHFAGCLAKEFVGLLSILPHIVRAAALYHSLPAAVHVSSSRHKKLPSFSPKALLSSWICQCLGVPTYSAAIVRNIQYRNKSKRTLLDVYLPTNVEHEEGSDDDPLLPVVMFVHGGVWASGDKWQFSTLGAFLASKGALAAVMQYTLYPEALAIEQAAEVSDAVSWMINNAPRFGGDPQRVILMGHSAGAHLSAMALWQRGDAAPQPKFFIGLAGVYDIAEHYKYEQWRGVEALSCMSRAMGGPKAFSSMSPTSLFASLMNSSTMQQDPKSLKSLLPTTCILFTSPDDTVVPPNSTIELHQALLQLGCDSRLVVSNGITHEKFVFWGNFEAPIKQLVQEILKVVHSS